MSVHLFAGIAVGDYAAALPWYERLLGSPPSFFPHDTEAVWDSPSIGRCTSSSCRNMPGDARQTIIVDDLDSRVAGIAQRGLEPAQRETYPNGVRKITYIDPDGNEIGFGGIPG